MAKTHILNSASTTTPLPTFEVLHIPCGHVTHVIDMVPANQRHLYPDRDTVDTLCKPCWVKQMERSKFRDDIPLPKLSGTERQVLWAESVRHKKLSAVANSITYARLEGDDNQVQRLICTYNVIRGLTRSSTWINGANKLPEQMEHEAARRKSKATV